MAAERRRFPEIDLATERLIEDLVDQRRATFAKRPRLVSVHDWAGLTGGEHQLILVAPPKPRPTWGPRKTLTAT